MLPPIWPGQLSDWEWAQLVSCHAELAEKMLMQRVRIHNSKPMLSEHFEDNVFEFLGINSQAAYYIHRGYGYFTVYFEAIIDMDRFREMFEKYGQEN